MAEQMLPVVVSYHYPCPDGIFAALAAHLSFAETGMNPMWVPNTVYNPRTVESLSLQVGQQFNLCHHQFERMPEMTNLLCLRQIRRCTCWTMLDHMHLPEQLLSREPSMQYIGPPIVLQ